MSLAREEEDGCVCREGEGRKEGEEAKGECEHDGVAMAADTTTVYLAALLNLIEEIIRGTWFLPSRKKHTLELNI